MSDKLTIGSTDKETELTELFIRAVRALTRFNQIADGVVTAVDAEVTFTCTVQVGTGAGAVPYTNVPLRTLIGSQPGDLEVPVLNTDCLIVWRSGLNERPQLLWVDQITTKNLTLQQLKINASQTQSGVVFNDGKNGGIPLAKPVENAGQATNDILEALINILTGPPIDEPGNGAPSALQQALATALAGKNVGDWSAATIENPAITQ